jgi:hypothetical protein
MGIPSVFASNASRLRKRGATMKWLACQARTPPDTPARAGCGGVSRLRAKRNRRDLPQSTIRALSDRGRRRRRGPIGARLAIRWGAAIAESRSAVTRLGERVGLGAPHAVCPGWTARVSIIQRLGKRRSLWSLSYASVMSSRRRGRRGPFDGAWRRGGAGASPLTLRAPRTGS